MLLVKQHEAERIQAMAARHTAVVNWAANLSDRRYGAPFAIDLTRAMVGSNTAPVLVETELRDIIQSSQNHVALFSGDVGTNDVSCSVHLFLSCTPAQAQSLLDSLTNSEPRFAVIARISDVGRPVFAAQAREHDLSVELALASGEFYAQGTLVDFLPLLVGP